MILDGLFKPHQDAYTLTPLLLHRVLRENRHSEEDLLEMSTIVHIIGESHAKI
jgi:hypothetical protein